MVPPVIAQLLNEIRLGPFGEGDAFVLVVLIIDAVPEGEIEQFWRMSWTALVPPAIRTQGTVSPVGGSRTRLFKVEIRPVRAPKREPLGSNVMRGRVVLLLVMVTPRSA